MLRSIGLLVGREIMFNVTFFPTFSLLKEGILPSKTPGSDHWMRLVACGIGAGIVSAIVVTPMDLAQAYFRHSRQHWHWWKGLHVKAPPFRVLGRGLLLQALCFGPAFGLVEVIYETNVQIKSI